ncbi:MAG: hypothetical protein FH751_17085 [Firmicutes bacterium]|nr:hypothetical protein [Bacillota bacterium]
MPSLVRILVILLIIIFTPSIIYAHELTDDLIIKDDMKVNSDVFFIGDKAYNYGIIIGDLNLLTNKVYNLGTVYGDLITFNKIIKIDGIIKGNLRVITSKANISGEIRKNITALARELIIDKGSVDGSITVFSNKLTIKGDVNSDIRGRVNTLIIDGKVKGDINVFAKEIKFSENAIVYGDLNYSNVRKIKVPKRFIRGDITFTKDLFNLDLLKRYIHYFYVLVKMIFMMCLLIIGTVLVSIYPKFFSKLEKKVNDYKTNLKLGIAISLLTPIISLLLIFTIIGIPIGIILLTIYIILLYLSYLPVSIWLGGKLLNKSNPLIKMIIGLLIIFTLSFIPYLGTIIKIITIIIGLGTLYNYFNSNKRVLKEVMN